MLAHSKTGVLKRSIWAKFCETWDDVSCLGNLASGSSGFLWIEIRNVRSIIRWIHHDCTYPMNKPCAITEGIKKVVPGGQVTSAQDEHFVLGSLCHMILTAGQTVVKHLNGHLCVLYCQTHWAGCEAELYLFLRSLYSRCFTSIVQYHLDALMG